MGADPVESGRSQGVGGAPGAVQPMGADPLESGWSQGVGGASVESGWSQAVGVASVESGRSQAVGGASGVVQPMGGAVEGSGRSQAVGGASGAIQPMGGSQEELWAELWAELRRSPGAPPPPAALWALVALPLPPTRKCRLVDAQALLSREPSAAAALRSLRVLEKCGRNLLRPRPPPGWQRLRCPSPALPDDHATLRVLWVLGYTEWGPQGRSFPPGTDPDPQRVAAVTAELLLLRAELEMLVANKHPNPHFFAGILKETPEEAPEEPLRGNGDREEGAAPHVQRVTPNCGEDSSGAQWGWECASCTLRNVGTAVLCAVCERPRLAPRPAPQGELSRQEDLVQYGEMSRHEELSRQGEPSRHEDLSRLGAVSRHEEAERRRQEALRCDGIRTVHIVREAELQGVPAEAVLLKAQSSGATPKMAVLSARAGLGAELRALMTSSGGAASGHAHLEAAAAWIRAQGRRDRALQRIRGQNRRRLRILLDAGVPPPLAEAAVRQWPGAGHNALAEAQRPKLRPFLRRVWEPREPPLDLRHGDVQVLARRALATLPLPSWGRAALLVAVGRELGLRPSPTPPSSPPPPEPSSSSSSSVPLPPPLGLRELLDAVRSCPDPALIRRRLRCECAVCGWALHREQMRWLTGCECALCPDCFRQHFTIGVKERAVSDLVCPACGRPDLKDEAARLCYFSTLDVQLRQELDAATYALFTQKLTERELLRDPQFLWCPKCSFGFIFEAERGPAQCPQCRQSCCPRCLRTWQAEHAALSCEDFERWLRERDPHADAVGLSAFLREHGIACPRCGQWFALARGGCLHFQCSQCGHHFCGGCGAAFHPRERCPRPRCPLRASLHAHHPRHCAFHLRDWEPQRLQRLLQVGGVPYDTQPPPGAQPPPGGGCWLQELKETPGSPPRDAACGRSTEQGHAGLCRAHYAEYLVRVINERGLDPALLYGAAELRAAAQRHLADGRPPQRPAESDAEYTARLRETLRREQPVLPRPAPK